MQTFKRRNREWKMISDIRSIAYSRIRTVSCICQLGTEAPKLPQMVRDYTFTLFHFPAFPLSFFADDLLASYSLAASVERQPADQPSIVTLARVHYCVIAALQVCVSSIPFIAILYAPMCEALFSESTSASNSNVQAGMQIDRTAQFSSHKSVLQIWNIWNCFKAWTNNESVWEQGAEKNIRTEEGWNRRRLEKSA